MQSRNPIFLIIVAALMGLSIWLYTIRPYSLGLDVQGGVRLTYQIIEESLKPEQRQNIPQIQSDLVRIMQSRAGSALGVTEGTVSKKGTDQIVIELPGYADINAAKAVLSTTAKIQVFHADNVQTQKRTTRPFVQAGDEEENGVPFITFARRSTPDKVLKPGDPAYAEMIKGWNLLIEGGDVTNAYPRSEGTNTVPEFNFGGEGAKNLEKFTRTFRNDGEMLAFVLDGKVLSINPVQEGTILKDNAYINGSFDAGYVMTLTDLIKAGSLPADLRELSSQKVDPTIGKKALGDIIFAGFISFGIVIAFLLVYYAFPGLVAALAMCLYVLLTITTLKLIGQTFSLAAIAGLILSIAMAVDANILIFERLKEEMKGGRTLATAMDLAFKRALAAIVDSNAATIGTSIILFAFGDAMVKGFATTLIVGVALSFFTAVAVTRAILGGLLSVGIGTNPKWYALERNWFGEGLEQRAETKPMLILEKRNTFFGISVGLMAIGFVFILLGGLKPNVEFLGGYEAIFQVPASQNASAPAILEGLEKAGVKEANVKFGEGLSASGSPTRLAYITIPANAGIQANDPAILTTIGTATGFPTEGASITEIGATIRGETIQNAIYGTIGSMAFIIILLAVRFGIALGGLKNGLKFGLSAILAMAHDIAVIFGVAAIVGYLLGWEVSGLFISAMLTVASFSVHDTIVIFDRIRENLRKPHKGQSFDLLVNKSITQTIARSLNTSGTAIVSLLVLIAVGTPTPELKFMCVAMVTGIVVGTYSSIFNAAPILYLWDKATIKSKGAAHGLMAEAEREIKLRATQMAMVPGGEMADAGYGTVKRRTSVADKATKPLDDE